MVFYPNFYFINKNEASKYSKKPSGYMNVSRLLKNIPSWKQPGLAADTKQRSLILADWTAARWSQKKITDVKIKLARLLDDGFPIYLWQDGKVEPFTIDTLHRLDDKSIRERIKPTFQSSLRSAAIKQHRLTQNQIHILDDYWIDYLLSEKEEPPERSLSMRELNQSPHNKQYILAVIKKSTPPLVSITQDEFSVNSSKSLLQTIKKYPNATIIHQYKSLRSDEPSSLQTAKESLCNFPLEFAPQIEDFQVSTAHKPIEAETLRKLLTNFSHLIQLNLTSCNITGDVGADIFLANLEALNLSFTRLSSSDLLSFLTQAINLKKLTITSDNAITSIRLANIPLKKLEEFVFYSESLSIENMRYILTEANQLKILRVRSNFHPGMGGIDITLEHLQELKIWVNDSSFMLLKKNAHIKKLTLINLSVGDILKTDFSFDKLEELDLESGKLSYMDMQKLFALAPHLKKLVINNFDVQADFPDLFDGVDTDSEKMDNNVVDSAKVTVLKALDNLEELSIDTSEISGLQLCNILAQTTHLKKLKLDDCMFLGSFTASSLPFAHLEELSIESCNIQSEEISNIFTQATHLKKLGIHFFEGIESFIESILRIGHLEELDISDLTISQQCFYHLLENTPQLKILNLEATIIVNADELYQIPVKLSLAKLEHIIMRYDTEISNEAYQAILDLAPNLEVPVFEEPEIPESEDEDTEDNNVTVPCLADASQTLDAETTYIPNTNYTVTRYFTSLNHTLTDAMICNYRLRTFDGLVINRNPCSVSKAFVLSNLGPIDLGPCLPTYTSDILAQGEQLTQSLKGRLCVLGRQRLALTNEWQAIASLSPIETMTHFHFEPKDASVEIYYSKRDNLYYIRSDVPRIVSFSFLLTIPPEPEEPIPDFIKQLVDGFKNFAQGSLTIDKENPCGDDYLRYISQQKKGSCRHRMLAFKALMQHQHPEIPVRMIMNDCHAFIEIRINGSWRCIDLGGYPSQLTINEPISDDASKESMEDGASEDMSIDETLPFEKELETWNKSTSDPRSITDYCNSIIQSVDVKKRLIELTSTSDIQAMQLHLEACCKQTARPCFYIHSPDDLVCSASFIQRELGSNNGVLTEGPGGPLHAFLTAPYDKGNPPLLIVNYDNFDADDIVRFNSLLDDKRHADGTYLSPDTMVVGLINTKKPDAYQGEDFYSRFDKTETCPLSGDQLYAALPALPLRLKKVDDGPTTIISLYLGNDWEERLLGYWEIQGDSFYFVEGELERAIRKGLPIEIQNGPWENDNFMRFWQQACLRGKIEHDGRKIVIPASLQLLQQEGYDWKALTMNVCWQPGLLPNAKVLNPSCFSEFFIRYEYDPVHKGLSTTSGILKTYAGQELHINLTRELSEDEWASFLSTCQQYQIQLFVHCAPSVTVPEQVTNGVSILPQAETPLHPWDGCLSGPTTALESTDINCTVAGITSHDSNWQVIDVSESDADDLLTHTNYDFNPKTAKLTLEQTKCALLVALEQNQKVILKGVFSPALVDALAPLLLERQHQPNAPGRLLLLSGTEQFKYLSTQRHGVTTEDKRQVLNTLFSSNEIMALPPEKFEEPFNQLRARLSYLRSIPDATSSDLAWEGLLKLPNDIKLSPFDATHSADISRSFNQQRLLDINKRLAHSPYVFLTGLTGVGKTSFVQKNLDTADNCLFEGLAQLHRWAEDTSPKRKILFIDEANLSQKQWSEFEGLFNHPPSILIEGKHCPLTEQHKVVFAGNPVNYGDERKLSPFFAAHGNALVFEPMPLEFIYEEILKPVFAKSQLEPHVEAICRPLLEVYRFLCEHAEDQILISPRELQMMALFVLSYSHQQKANFKRAIDAAHYYAYQMGKNLLPEQHHASFDNQFKAESKRPKRVKKIKDHSPEFIVTRSRSRIEQQLDDILNLREFKQHFSQNDAQRYGGLGGIVLEGEPGIGKSEMVIYSLCANGYQEVKDFQDRPNKVVPEKPFYNMPASMQIDDKKRLLLTAFHEGAIVLCDEINS